jgi:hypothetical protein
VPTAPVVLLAVTLRLVVLVVVTGPLIAPEVPTGRSRALTLGRVACDLCEPRLMLLASYAAAGRETGINPPGNRNALQTGPLGEMLAG